MNKVEKRILRLSLDDMDLKNTKIDIKIAIKPIVKPIKPVDVESTLKILRSVSESGV